MSISRAFVDNNVERVLHQTSFHADVVVILHSVSFASSSKLFKLKERFWKTRDQGLPYEHQMRSAIIASILHF